MSSSLFSSNPNASSNSGASNNGTSTGVGSMFSGLGDTFKTATSGLTEQFNNIAGSATQGLNSATQGLNDLKTKVSGITSSVTNDISNSLGQPSSINTNFNSTSAIPANLAGSTLRNFSLSNYANMSSEFLESNSLVAKLAFLLLVVFTFFVLLRLISGLISYFMNSSNFNPTKLIDGMSNANEPREFPQSPSDPGNKTIYRSSNEAQGIEFTWSTYLFIKDLPSGKNAFHVFHKGNNNIDSTTGINSPNNGPGLYIIPPTAVAGTNSTVSLKVLMSTYNSIGESIVVPNVPLNKWINVVIRCQNLKIDVYINGLIAQSYQLTSVPKQNYDTVHVASNGGFPGFISNLFYYSYALTISEIQRLNNYGPSLKMTTNAISQDKPNADYLSLRWYTN